LDPAPSWGRYFSNFSNKGKRLGQRQNQEFPLHPFWESPIQGRLSWVQNNRSQMVCLIGKPGTGKEKRHF